VSVTNEIHEYTVTVAEQDGRLRSGDRILQIGGIDVRDLSTEDVATVLRQSGVHVHLIVSRSVDSMPNVPDSEAPVIPANRLDEHLAYINRGMDFSRLSSDADLSTSLQSLPVSLVTINQT